MPSGVIFLAIVAIWAAILLPRFARYYDRTSSQRSTRRFRRAMQTLGGVKRVRPVDVTHVRRPVSVPAASARSATTAPREVVILDPAVDLHLDHGTDPFRGSPEEVDLVAARIREERRVASAIAASRRRRVLYGLLLFAALLAGLVVAGVVTPLVLVAPAAAVVGFVALSSVLARESRLRGRRQEARAARQREMALANVVPLAPVTPVRRHLQDASGEGAAMSRGATVRVVDFGGVAALRRSTAARPGSLFQARVLEQHEAIAATYPDAEAMLGLDDYATPATHDEIAYLRVVNE